MEKIYQKHDTQHVAATMLYVPNTNINSNRRFYYDEECTKGVTGKELIELFFAGRCIVYDPSSDDYNELVGCHSTNGGACGYFKGSDYCGYTIDYSYVE